MAARAECDKQLLLKLLCRSSCVRPTTTVRYAVVNGSRLVCENNNKILSTICLYIPIYCCICAPKLPVVFLSYDVANHVV